MTDDKLDKVATDVAVIRQRLEDFIKTQNDHETRIRVLEKFRYYVMGAIALATAIISIISNLKH